MSVEDTQKHREWVMTTLTAITSDLRHIKEKVDRNETYVVAINGRVRTNEKAISFVKGVGTVIGTIFSIFFGFILKRL